MIDFFWNLFSTEGFYPRGRLNGLNDGFIFLFNFFDILIHAAFAFTAITVWWLWSKAERLPIRTSTVFFLIFFLFYSAYHLLLCVTDHWPIYRALIVAKAICSLLIWGVVFYMVKEFPGRVKYYRFKEEIEKLQEDNRYLREKLEEVEVKKQE